MVRPRDERIVHRHLWRAHADVITTQVIRVQDTVFLEAYSRRKGAWCVRLDLDYPERVWMGWKCLAEQPREDVP
ncbi:MAG: hypothetical protein JRJ84_20770 [Deltaproteobacteria bacterium]|nr:hypothetical protein [Deltaproteobacteria bacterium]